MKIEPNHNFSGDEWKIRFAKPPRREKERKIRISGGKARLNFGRAFTAGAANDGKKFSSGKTWSVSVMAKVVSGVKNKGYSGAYARYIERPGECLSAYGDSESSKKFNELDEKLLSENPKRVIQRKLDIPVPKEWLNDPDKLTEKFGKLLEEKYFDVCYTWNMALHQGGNDFKNPHIHVIFAPVDSELKNIRDFSKQNKGFLQSVKEDVKDFVSNELGINAVLKEYKKNKEPGAIKHYPKWVANALKRAEAAEQAGDGGKMMRDYAEKYPIFQEYQDERHRKKLEKNLSENIEKSKELLAGQKKIMSKMQKSIFLSRAGKEIISNELKDLKKEGYEMCNFLKKKEKIQEPQPRPKQQAEKEKTREPDRVPEISKVLVEKENLKIFELEGGKILIRHEYIDITGDEDFQARSEDLWISRLEKLKETFPDYERGDRGYTIKNTPENVAKLSEFELEDEKIIAKHKENWAQELAITEHKREMRQALREQKRGGFER